MNNYEFLIVILVLTSLLGFHLTYKYYKLYKINYSNYRNALLALADSDPELKEYLEKENII